MPESCCAVGCTNRCEQGIKRHFLDFHHNPDRRSKWVSALRCNGFQPMVGLGIVTSTLYQIVWINDFIACCTVSWHFATINSRILVQEEEFALRDFECEHFVIPTKTAQKQIKFKLDMFKKLKVGVQFYCFFVIIIYFLSLLLYPRPFQELFLEGADIFIFAFLAMVFHLKDFSEYEGFHYLFPRNTFVILRPFADSFCPKEEQFMIGTREFTRGSDNEGPVSLQKPTHI